MSDKKNYYEIASITKACKLIDILAMRDAWDLAELTKELAMPKSTIQRILLTLQDNGYVVQEKEKGKYSLSFKMFSIGSKVLKHSSIVDVAKPYCRELLQAVDETINLCVPYGADMLVVDRHLTSKTLRQDTEIGETFPLLQSASGKVFIAFADKAELKHALDIAQNKHGAAWVNKQMQHLEEEINDVRKTGFAYDAEEVFKGVRCIAAPIFNFQDKIINTLSVSVPTVRLTAESTAEIKKYLGAVAQKLSRRLGASAKSQLFNELEIN